MANVVLNKEDGSCVPSANSYAAEADGDSYHNGHLYATKWTTATTDQKRQALVMATRLVDAYCAFAGFKKSADQALQWPRVQVPDRDANASGVTCLGSDSVPQCVVDATCELARELLTKDRTAAPNGEGLRSSSVAGASFSYDKSDRPPVLTATVMALLSRVVLSGPQSMTVRLIRV